MCALVEAKPRRQRAGRDIAHDHLERNDLDLADQLLAHVEAFHEVRGHADLAKPLEDIFGDPIVEHTLAVDQSVLLIVERRRIVLEMLDQGARLWSLVQDLGFSLVYPTPPVHLTRPCLQLVD